MTIEIRGIWITTTDSNVLNSRSNIAQTMDFLAETGFNVVFPVVWNKAATQFPSRVMEQTFGIRINPIFSERDPLQEVVSEAHRVGLKVIPWFEYGFASSYKSNGGLLLAKKPEWMGCDRNGNLLTKNGFEWMNALDLEVQTFISNLILEVVQNYDVDGIQGDDRLPAFPCEGGYEIGTVKYYYQQFGTNPPVNPKDAQWLQWRADILTEFWANLYQQIKAINPNLIVSISPNIHDWAYKEYLQDTPAWLQRGIVDMIHPQIYRRDFPNYKLVVDKLVNEQFSSQDLVKLAPGILMKIGSYIISSEDLIKILQYNRKCGINGEVFFFYEGLRDNNNQLAKVLRDNFYSQSAIFPTISDLNRPSVTHDNLSWWKRLQGFLKNL
jgi:uncharacterized lipoprotein YddW (UPF0748 family)